MLFPYSKKPGFILMSDTREGYSSPSFYVLAIREVRGQEEIVT
jgi:hypothetical protein